MREDICCCNMVPQQILNTMLYVLKVFAREEFYTYVVYVQYLLIRKYGGPGEGEVC